MVSERFHQYSTLAEGQGVRSRNDFQLLLKANSALKWAKPGSFNVLQNVWVRGGGGKFRSMLSFLVLLDLQMNAVGITENVKGDHRKFEIWYSGREEVYVVQVGRFKNLDVCAPS